MYIADLMQLHTDFVQGFGYGYYPYLDEIWK